MNAKPAKTESGKEKRSLGSRKPRGLLAGILPIQEEIRQLIAFFIDFVTIGLDFLKDEADRIGRRYQVERANMPLNNQIAFSNAFLDYRETRRGTTPKLGHLAAAKRAMDALHVLVDIESDSERLKRFHEMKVELMMNVLRILIDILKDMNKMSDDLKRAESTLSV